MNIIVYHSRKIRASSRASELHREGYLPDQRRRLKGWSRGIMDERCIDYDAQCCFWVAEAPKKKSQTDIHHIYIHILYVLYIYVYDAHVSNPYHHDSMVATLINPH